jgi:hypothetical protein
MYIILHRDKVGPWNIFTNKNNNRFKKLLGQRGWGGVL